MYASDKNYWHKSYSKKYPFCELISDINIYSDRYVISQVFNYRDKRFCNFTVDALKKSFETGTIAETQTIKILKNENSNLKKCEIINFRSGPVGILMGLAGCPKTIFLTLKKENNLNTIMSKVHDTENLDQIVGYRICKGNNLPKIFLSGPGAFEESYQFYLLDRRKSSIHLLFVASPKVDALAVVPFIKFRFIEFLRSHSIRYPKCGKWAKVLLHFIELNMLKIHERVHREFIVEISNRCGSEFV